MFEKNMLEICKYFNHPSDHPEPQLMQSFYRPLEPASTLNRPGIVQGKRSGTNVPSPPKEGKRKFPGIETHTTSPPKEGKRKFPGPAGILPKLG